MDSARTFSRRYSTANIPPVPLIEKALPVAAGTGRTASFVAAPRTTYLPKGSAVAMGFADVIFLLSLFGATSVSSAPLPTTLAVKKEAGLESLEAREPLRLVELARLSGLRVWHL